MESYAGHIQSIPERLARCKQAGPRPGHFGPARAQPSTALIVPGPARSTPRAVLGPSHKPTGLLRHGPFRDGPCGTALWPGWPAVHRHGPGMTCFARLVGSRVPTRIRGYASRIDTRLSRSVVHVLDLCLNVSCSGFGLLVEHLFWTCA
jgi:hypothetical protein